MSEPSAWELLLEHYKLRVGWITAHYDRIMRRLQLFLTLETAAAAAGILSSKGEITPAAPWITGLEAFLSAAWLMVGRSDRRMLKIYNYQLQENWECLATLAKVTGHTSVGSVQATDAEVDKPSGLGVLVENKSIKDVPLGSALIPLLLIPFWLLATAALLLHELKVI